MMVPLKKLHKCLLTFSKTEILKVGRVLLLWAAPKAKTMASWGGVFTTTHEAIIDDEMFQTVPQGKLSHAKNPKNMIAMNLLF